ncbi:MAG: hypothetical protein GC180_07340 [Bacteroidetes bacterium]|nr:hypothetical protein [Bacteroidota bacterium]
MSAFSQTADSLYKDSLRFREVNIPIEVKEFCEQEKYQIQWFTDHLDSSDFPKYVYLKGYRYDEDDSSKIFYRNVRIDSITLFRTSGILVNPPGHYWLEATDSSRRIIYSSDKRQVELCALFQLPAKYVIGSGKMYQPQLSQNIQKIDLVIFDALGNEVYKTKNPQFKWDGRNQNTAELCQPGSYFYHCDVWEIHGSEIVRKNFTGIIEIHL